MLYEEDVEESEKEPIEGVDESDQIIEISAEELGDIETETQPPKEEQPKEEPPTQDGPGF